MPNSSSSWLSSIEDVIEDARQGRMFILVDDESRENEGDLVIPAQMATPDVINFMAKHGRGLICLSLTRERADHLGLQPMTSKNQAQHQTAFTVSIEAREGVTTGISAADRAQTIAVAIGHNRTRDDLVSPGHVFPLVAQDGGVMVRSGHTEAAVDVARLAGLDPSGVICEIMNDDGTMARMPDLVEFARHHKLRIATIADLIAYRRRTEKLVDVIAESMIESRHGGPFKVRVYANKVAYAEHVALIREPTPTTIGRMIKERDGEPMRKPVDELRQFGIGAQMLMDIGVRNMILLTHAAHKMVGIDGYGMTVVEQRPIPEIED